MQKVNCQQRPGVLRSPTWPRSSVGFDWVSPPAQITANSQRAGPTSPLDNALLSCPCGSPSRKAQFQQLSLLRLPSPNSACGFQLSPCYQLCPGIDHRCWKFSGPKQLYLWLPCWVSLACSPKHLSDILQLPLNSLRCDRSGASSRFTCEGRGGELVSTDRAGRGLLTNPGL